MSYFTPKLFKFLKDLEHNNERDWFADNKQRYEDDVREPALAFINDFGPKLEKITPHFVADARKVGGSMFRIHRDTRFSKDKTPYKINTGLHFRHENAKNAYAPGFYLHLESGGCFAGVGIWRPESEAVAAIRTHIAESSKDWNKVLKSAPFKRAFVIEGESLKRPPKGFDKDHPLIEDLKRKDFIATTKLTQKQVTSDTFINDFAKICKTGSPFMKFLCDGLKVDY